MRTLTFQNITLTPIKIDNQIWLTSSELAKALDYADTQSVTKIYERNADEFTSSMTTIAEVKTNGGLQKTRIFSLKGCHLIAMFARTAVAKQFRQWVLDILDKEVGQPTSQKTTAHQRQALVTACDKLAVGNTLRSDIYKMVGNQFGVDDVANIPMDKIPEAVAFVYAIILAKQHTPTTTQTNQKDQSHLTQADALILAKVLDYARLYANFAPKIQTPKGQEHITTLYCNNTSNEDDGFFICYRPNYKDDIEKAMTLFRNIAQNSLLPTT